MAAIICDKCGKRMPTAKILELHLIKTHGGATQEVATVIKPEIAALVVLVVTNEAMLPVPELARPIAVLLFVQSYVVPDTKEPDNVIIDDELPLQKAIFV